MLDRLRGGNDADVEHGLVLDLAHEVAAFLDDAVDGGALRAARLLAVQCEHLLQPFDLLLGLPQMVLQAAFELGIRCVFDHVGQRLHDLVLGVIDILQAVLVEILEILDVLGKQPHGCLLAVGPGIREKCIG